MSQIMKPEILQSGPLTGILPENLYLIGLMNTADRSLAMVDYALRRRFRFADLRPAFETEQFRKILIEHGATPEFVATVVRRMTTLNKEIADHKTNLGSGYCIGHSYFCDMHESAVPNKAWFNKIIRSEIEPLLREYWFDNPKQAESLIQDTLLAD